MNPEVLLVSGVGGEGSVGGGGIHYPSQGMSSSDTGPKHPLAQIIAFIFFGVLFLIAFIMTDGTCWLAGLLGAIFFLGAIWIIINYDKMEKKYGWL